MRSTLEPVPAERTPADTTAGNEREAGAPETPPPPPVADQAPQAATSALSMTRSVAGTYARFPAPGDRYRHRPAAGLLKVADQPLSTFSVDVDTASYANVRRYLGEGALPHRDAVRLEEIVNYFDYRYPPAAAGGDPIRISTDVGPAPWAPGTLLARIGLQTRALDVADLPPANLVFLIDVS